MKELGRAKVFSRDGGDELLIEALAPIEGSEEFRSIAFKESRIDYLFAFDEKLSGIVLHNGVTIPVVLPFAELKARIYGNDFTTGDRIDLTLVTGKAVAEEKQLRLSKKFNPAAESATSTGPEKPVDIVVFAHAEPTDLKFRRLRVSEAQIAYFEPHVDRKEKETFFSLKAGHTIDGWNKFYVALPLSHFTYYLNKAKNEGQEVADMSEASRPKDCASLKVR